MSPFLLALALCAQAPPGPATITAPDGTVYRVTYTPVARPIGQVPPPPATTPARDQSDMGGLDRLYDRPARTPVAATEGLLYPSPQNPTKSAPTPVTAYATPQTQQAPTTTVVRQNPPNLTYQVTQTVTLKQPGCIDRAIAAVGLKLCQRGLPRPQITSASVGGFAQTAPTITYTVTAPAPPPPTYASPQQ